MLTSERWGGSKLALDAKVYMLVPDRCIFDEHTSLSEIWYCVHGIHLHLALKQRYSLSLSESQKQVGSMELIRTNLPSARLYKTVSHADVFNGLR